MKTKQGSVQHLFSRSGLPRDVSHFPDLSQQTAAGRPRQISAWSVYVLAVLCAVSAVTAQAQGPAQTARQVYGGARFAEGILDSDGVQIPAVPPEHPRLYLRAERAAQLPQRLKDPVLREAVEGLRALGSRSAQFKMEWDALQYLVTRDNALGRATIEATSSELK